MNEERRDNRTEELGEGVEQVEPFWRKMTGEKCASWETLRMTTFKRENVSFQGWMG